MALVRSLRTDELDPWLELVSGVFGEPRNYFERHWQNDPWRDLDGIRVAVVDGQIAATLRVFRRRIYLGGSAVTMGGIGEVATRPAYRNQGLSGLLLQDALRWMAEQGLAVSVLFSGLHAHYSRYGWAVVPVRIGVAEVTPVSSPRWAIQPMAPQDLPALERLHEQFSQRFDGPVVRSTAYWEAWIQGEPHTYWVAWDGEQPAGYLGLRRMPAGDYRTADFAAAPGADARAVFTALAGHAAALSGEPLRVRFPLAACPVMDCAEESLSNGAMYRAVRPDLLPPSADRALQRLLSGETDRHLFLPADGF